MAGQVRRTCRDPGPFQGGQLATPHGARGPDAVDEDHPGGMHPQTLAPLPPPMPTTPLSSLNADSAPPHPRNAERADPQRRTRRSPTPTAQFLPEGVELSLHWKGAQPSGIELSMTRGLPLGRGAGVDAREARISGWEMRASRGVAHGGGRAEGSAHGWSRPGLSALLAVAGVGAGGAGVLGGLGRGLGRGLGSGLLGLPGLLCLGLLDDRLADDALGAVRGLGTLRALGRVCRLGALRRVGRLRALGRVARGRCGGALSGLLRLAHGGLLGAHRLEDELDDGHRGVVALARSGLGDAGVAAVALGHRRGDLGEELVDDALVLDRAHHLAAGVEVTTLGQGDEPLDDRAQPLGAVLGGRDRPVLEQRGGEVRQHVPLVGGAATKTGALGWSGHVLSCTEWLVASAAELDVALVGAAIGGVEVDRAVLEAQTQARELLPDLLDRLGAEVADVEQVGLAAGHELTHGVDALALEAVVGPRLQTELLDR